MKKILSIILCAMLVFYLFACANPQTDEGATPTPADDVTPTQGEDITENGKYLDYPAANGNMDYRLPALELTSKEIVYLTHVAYTEPDPTTDDALRDGYGITVISNVVGASERITKFITLQMANEGPEIFNYEFMPTLVNKGYCLAWDEYIDFDLGLWTDIRDSIESLRYRGNIYTMGISPSRGCGIFYNKTIFEDLGLKTPEEYFNDGEWTWDTLRMVAEQTTVDSDGDGIPEVYGYSPDNMEFIWSTGVDMVSFDSNGTVTNNIKSEGIADAVSLYVEMYDRSFSYTGSDCHDMFAKGKIAMNCTGIWRRATFKDMIAAGDVGVVPYPKVAGLDKYYINEDFATYTMAATAKNPMGAAAFLYARRYEKLNTKDIDYASMNTQEQIEALGWTYEMQLQYDKMFYGEHTSPVMPTWVCFEMGDFMGEIFFRPLLGEPWATIAEEIAPKMDDKIMTIMED